jgi:ATP-binding cassette, subfamily F, member 3
LSLVTADELTLGYGVRMLFDGASFAIGPRDRVGLVGVNGTGKSTLLKMLAGRQQPDRGALRFRRNTRIGYLPQELVELPDAPLTDAVLSAVPGRDELERKRAGLEDQVGHSVDEAELLELAQSLADLHAELEHFDERHGRHRAERILQGLGFETSELDRLVSTLSGGWRMRAALAGLLLQDPDLLLLDEPTNHLDLPTLTWFDDFLKRSTKALVLVSHDRDFLDRQIDRVMALEVEGLRSYAGNYSTYRERRQLEEEQLDAEAERLAARRDEIRAFVDRFRAKATKARQAQSRLKMLDRMAEVEVREKRRALRFRFPEVPRSGRDVVRLSSVSHAYGGHAVYRGASALLERGQRVAVAGRNGAGKTTLLKLIAGELSPDSGEVTLGEQVTLAYYAQHHSESLDRDSAVIDEIARLVPEQPQGYLRGVLGAFLFSGDDVDKKVGVLSGGERARVALAKLLVRPANLLLLDEPTNHLDVASSEALIEALAGYGGTLLFVSHNRSFLNRLATHIWEVKDGSVSPLPGNLDDYLERLRRETLDPVERATPVPNSGSAKVRRRVEAEARQRRSAVETPIKQQIAVLEARIAELERSQKDREAQLADSAFYQDFARAKPVLEQHRRDAAELEALYARWESLETELGAARAADDMLAAPAGRPADEKGRDGSSSK